MNEWIINNWRMIAVVVLLTLSLVDLGATYYYVSKYKKWQPEKPYNLIENNPLLVFLWNQLGLTLGTIVGAAIIWTLIYIVGKSAHWIVVLILFIFLLYALFNHWTNINLLHKLISRYPNGKLPEEVFGKVIGNNPK